VGARREEVRGLVVMSVVVDMGGGAEVGGGGGGDRAGEGMGLRFI
jgi:hypothetical protein